MEQVGLQAILEDKNFQEGLKRFNDGTNQMVQQSDKSASAISHIGSIASGALTAGLAIGVASIAAFAAAGKQGLATTLAWGEQLDKLGDQFGMNAKTADVWATAMDRMGVSPEEGGMQLNFFTKQLDDVKKAGEGSKQTVIDNTKKISALKTQLLDANTQLDRAKQKFSQAKKPTQEMAWAVQDAQKKVDRLNAELKATPATTTKIKEAAAQLTPFQKALDKLGVSAFDAQGKTKTWDKIMPEIMAKFKTMPAGVEASAIAMDLFGTRGGSKFLDFLRDGNEALAMAAVRIDQFGGMTDEQVAAVEQFGRETKDTEDLLRRLGLQIGNVLLPYVRDFINYINKNVLPTLIEWAKEVMPKVSSAIDWMRGAVKNLIDAFRTGDWSKVQKDVGGLLQKLGDELNKKWPDIQKQLETWGTQFWNWLTDPTTGVISKTWTEVGKLSTELNKRLEQEWPNIQAQLRKWKDEFWDWLTNPQTGAIIETGKKMDQLSNAFKAWTTSPEGRKTFRDVGKSVGEGILAGLSDFFKSGDATKDTRTGFLQYLQNFQKNVATGIASAGASFGEGIMESILKSFMDPETAHRLAIAFSYANEKMIYEAFNSTSFQGYVAAMMQYFGDLMRIGLNNIDWNGVITAITSPFAQAWNWISKQDWQALGTTVGALLRNGLTLAGGILNAILGPFITAWNWVLAQDWGALGRSVVSSIVNGITSVGWQIADALTAPLRQASGQYGLNVNDFLPANAPQAMRMPGTSAGSNVSNVSTVNNYFTLNNYSTAPASNIAGDFRILQSLAG